MVSDRESPNAVGQEAPGIRAFIGLGANVGDRRANIEAALVRLTAPPAIAVIRRTEPVETAPWGVEDQPAFLNAIAEVRTTMEPLDLLYYLKRLETELGRTPGPRWGPRAIDLDILLFGDRVIDEPALVVPHPAITDRPFVVRQLLQLDAGIVHPRLQLPLAHIAGAGAGGPKRSV